jgi:probable blue pigment (indigoidine) exporter
MNVGRRTSLSTGSSSPPAISDSGWDLILLVVLGALWGSAYPVIRAGIVAGAPPLLFAATRYGVTALLLVPIAFLSGARRPTIAQIGPVALYGGLLIVGLYGTFLYLGEETTSGGLAAVLTASVALWSALIGYQLLPRERFSRVEVAGLLVGFGGVAVLVLPEFVGGGGSTLFGSLLVLLAVVSFSAGGVLLRRSTPGDPSLWTLTVQFAVAAALTGAVALGLGEPLTMGNSNVTAPALAYLIVAPSILGYTIYFRLHHRVGPSRANLVGYVGPIAGVLVGLFVFGESVGGFEIGGMVLIVAGLILVQRGRTAPMTPVAGSAERG